MVSTRLLADAIDAGLTICATASGASSSLANTRELRRRLHVIELVEPESHVLLHELLPAVAKRLEAQHGVEIVKEALATAVRRSQGGVAQPAAAIAVLEQAAIRANSHKSKVVGPDDLL